MLGEPVVEDSLWCNSFDSPEPEREQQRVVVDFDDAGTLDEVTVVAYASEQLLIFFADTVRRNESLCIDTSDFSICDKKSGVFGIGKSKIFLRVLSSWKKAMKPDKILPKFNRYKA